MKSTLWWYDSLLNTDLRRELDQYGRFLTMVVGHKHRIGFKGTILLEPKPFEPTKHQYDHDVAAVFAFLHRYKLADEVKVNLEVNHATLAGLDFEHEVAIARTYGIFGSIDLNRGDPRNGWDTDQFPNNAQDLVPAMLQLLQEGGFTTGGINFDAKLRRQSTDPWDLYLAHIGLNAHITIKQGWPLGLVAVVCGNNILPTRASLTLLPQSLTSPIHLAGAYCRARH